MSGAEPSSERCRWAEEEEAAALARQVRMERSERRRQYISERCGSPRGPRADKYRFCRGALGVKSTQFSGAS